MSKTHRLVIQEIVESALQELSDIGFQKKEWIEGGTQGISSMNEAAAALFNDSGLDEALEKNDVTFTLEIDRELRELRNKLHASLMDQQRFGATFVLASPEWKKVVSCAAYIRHLLTLKH